MFPCEYCDRELESRGELVDHLLECEDRSQYLKLVADDGSQRWFDRTFAHPDAPRVHNLLDDVAIVFGSLYPLPDAVFAAGLLAVDFRPIIVVSANHWISQCTLEVSPGGIRWSLQIGDFQNSCEWRSTDTDYALAREVVGASPSSTGKAYKSRVVQSLQRLCEVLTLGDLSTVYTFGEVGDVKLLRDALRGGDIECVVWQYTWDPHAEIKLLYHATRNQLTWCSRYIGVSKLMCHLCDAWYRSYNAYHESGFLYLGAHDHVFRYWKLPVLPELGLVVASFEIRLRNTVGWTLQLKEEGEQIFRVYKAKMGGKQSQIRDRSPGPERRFQ